MLNFLKRRIAWLPVLVAAGFVLGVGIKATIAALPQNAQIVYGNFAVVGGQIQVGSTAANAGAVAPHNVAATSPANQTGTASTTFVMDGLAGSFTPVSTGNVLLMMTGVCNNSTIADGNSIQMSYGTGTAPTNGAAVTGTQVGAIKTFVASTAAGYQGCSLSAEVTGLTIGTVYWVDVAIKAVTGGTATLQGVDLLAIEN